MDYAALSTVSFEQRTAHPWILCMALRQHRYSILLRPFMRAIQCSDWIRVQASQCHIMLCNPSRRAATPWAASFYFLRIRLTHVTKVGFR